MVFIATCLTFGVQVHVRHMPCIVDVVKAVNAWVCSAFGNVFTDSIDILHSEQNEEYMHVEGVISLCSGYWCQHVAKWSLLSTGHPPQDCHLALFPIARLSL